MEADFGRDFLETSNKILKTTDRICKIAVSLNSIRFNFKIYGQEPLYLWVWNSLVVTQRT